MKKIKIFPCPHVELRLHVSDEMEKDFKECAELTEMVEGRDCDTCSWNDVVIDDRWLCGCPAVRERLIGGEKDVSEAD